MATSDSILLNGAADVTLLTTSISIDLRWNANISKWQETGRCIV